MWFISLKLCVKSSIFNSDLFLLNLYCCSKKSMNSLTLKHSFFQNNNNRKATHSSAPKTVIFMLQQEA